MLPDIVRAAAEPMGRIGSLTVLSSDGASEMVKTTTRTVAEAGATVKGLTGIDVAGLINEAVGRQGGITGDGNGPAASDALRGGSPTVSPSAAAGPTTRARPAPRRPAAPTPDAQPTAEREPEPAERFAEAVESIERAGTVQPATEPAVSIPARMSLEEAEAVVGEALDRVPGIRRYAEMPVSELGERGPRAARRIWDALPKRARDRFGSETIATILERRRPPTR